MSSVTQLQRWELGLQLLWQNIKQLMYKNITEQAITVTVSVEVHP